MDASQEYMDKFIDNLPKPPNVEEYRLYLYLKSKELILSFCPISGDTQETKASLYKNSAKYVRQAKKNDAELIDYIKYRFGLDDKNEPEQDKLFTGA